jgi:tRNA A-37 threonylcarbamoyl transferase component Bud32
MIIALKTLHGLGYSHGDLKPANICARKTKEGKMKFTLIDFGLCQKLPKPDKPRK